MQVPALATPQITHHCLLQEIYVQSARFAGVGLRFARLLWWNSQEALCEHSQGIENHRNNIIYDEAV